MPVCPFCMLLVSVSKRGFIYRHNIPATQKQCSATGLTIDGAKDYLERTPQSSIHEEQKMGMFDKPEYLTGDSGYAQPGQTFWLHAARLDGTVTVQGKEREQVKLQVSRDRDGERSIVFASGTGIVGQIRRMDEKDRAAMPMEVRLDQVPSKQGNPTNVLTPAATAPPAAVADDDIPF